MPSLDPNQSAWVLNPKPWTCESLDNGMRCVIRDRAGLPVLTHENLGFEEGTLLCLAVNGYDEAIGLLQLALRTSAPDLLDTLYPGWYRRAHEAVAKATTGRAEPQS